MLWLWYRDLCNLLLLLRHRCNQPCIRLLLLRLLFNLLLPRLLFYLLLLLLRLLSKLLQLLLQQRILLLLPKCNQPLALRL